MYFIIATGSLHYGVTVGENTLKESKQKLRKTLPYLHPNSAPKLQNNDKAPPEWKTKTSLPAPPSQGIPGLRGPAILPMGTRSSDGSLDSRSSVSSTVSGEESDCSDTRPTNHFFPTLSPVNSASRHRTASPHVADVTTRSPSNRTALIPVVPVAVIPPTPSKSVCVSSIMNYFCSNLFLS